MYAAYPCFAATVLGGFKQAIRSGKRPTVCEEFLAVARLSFTARRGFSVLEVVKPSGVREFESRTPMNRDYLSRSTRTRS